MKKIWSGIKIGASIVAAPFWFVGVVMLGLDKPWNKIMKRRKR